MADINWLEATW